MKANSYESKKILIGSFNKDNLSMLNAESNCVTESRIGIISMTDIFMEKINDAGLSSLFSQLVPLDVKHNYPESTIDIKCASPLFRKVEHGSIIPKYSLEFSVTRHPENDYEEIFMKAKEVDSEYLNRTENMKDLIEAINKSLKKESKNA